ncbi:hypothetical protein [Paracoccus litorisediminis]|uniref:Uncharacterized protein n=1 Tax=Paracoccus litorisediminis TaxID=2006130 RepID=A0A844HMQ7_9RHOB|nr:hypothetical protein [Paracoccus litorisediminis]MTH61156.1 hypothetical protein [Paracoccus litorisediminis]
MMTQSPKYEILIGSLEADADFLTCATLLPGDYSTLRYMRVSTDLVETVTAPGTTIGAFMSSVRERIEAGEEVRGAELVRIGA